MSGAVKMYRTRLIIQNDVQIRIPKCMYPLKNIHAKDSKEMVADHVSTTINSRIIDQNNHQIPGMAELEAKQEDILKQLSDLKKQILSIKLDLKITPNSTKQQTSCPNGPPERLCDLPDIVINVSPTHPPLSLEILQKLLHDTVELKITTHLHSSVSALPEIAQKLEQSLRSHSSKNSIPKVNIRLIWKSVGVDSELQVSNVPIRGEVNLLRYLSRVIRSPFSYDSDSDSIEIDSILDICYLLLRSKTKSERANHLVTLNKSLGKNEWLAGRSTYSLGDVAAYSAIKQVSNSEINANLTKWYQRCQTVF